MVLKPENHSDIKTALSYLKTKDDKLRIMEVLYAKDIIDQIKRTPDFIRIGDMNLPFNSQVKHVVRKLQTRLDTASHRTKMYDLYGYDLKFASHIVRLLFEGIELLDTGKLTFPLESKSIILDIKDGKYKLNEVMELTDDLEVQLKTAESTSSLRAKPNFEFINNLCKSILRDYYTDPMDES